MGKLRSSLSAGLLIPKWWLLSDSQAASLEVALLAEAAG